MTKRQSVEKIDSLKPSELLEDLEKMLLIRHFETRGEAAYQQGKVGGFYHSYIGQEALQVALIRALGVNNWYTTSYRCHALALLLGATPEELMAELYGKATGNAKGRGGSMHFFTDRMLGGHGIVGGQVPIATGAAFTSKYLKKDELSICFLGDGAVAQGAFYESMNLASLWRLPCLYVIENNRWGMGTAVKRAIAVEKIAEKKAVGHGIEGHTVDGMDYFAIYELFSSLKGKVLKDPQPILIEANLYRFKGHSISDPGLYRTKDELTLCMQKDPILMLKKVLLDKKILTEETFKHLDEKARKQVVQAMEIADSAPWPDPATLEEDVFAR